MDQELIKRILSSIILIPVCLFLIIKGSILFNIFLLICFFITIYEWQIMIKNNFYKYFGLIFLILSFYSLYLIRNDFDKDYKYLLFVLIICISTDIGGYVFGKIFKGPKLTKISPNKTISGTLGAFFLSLSSIIIFFKFNYFNSSDDISMKVFIYVILISTISQLGDITISYFKRISNIKDTGKIIPGHGGILDRIDGMLFAFPFSYILFLLNLIQL
tara:strand:- start:185 stop:835 length:651 start_codon:yes stop_codon:yes gene_type:complete